MGNLTKTAIGSVGGACPSWYRSACVQVPGAPLQRPASAHKFAVSITCVPTAMKTTG